MDLSTYELTAINFAKESSNKIHSDEVARSHGFKGALVPGIAVYAYMTRPVVEHLGTDWLERGTITAKFIRPIYEGASVRVCVRRSGSKTNEYEIEILDISGALCAVGWAGFGAVGAEAPRACDYPHRFLPAPEERMAPRVANLLPGTLLEGPWNFTQKRMTRNPRCTITIWTIWLYTGILKRSVIPHIF